MRLSENQLRKKVRKALKELLSMKPKSKDSPSFLQTMLGGSGIRYADSGGGGGGGGYSDDYYDYYGDYDSDAEGDLGEADDVGED
tara:strand:+ start:26 stop:280 length:255 start_codon:yes stop_codon:yes gene_type:complete